MRLIDGQAIAQKILAELKEKITASGLKPGLGVILVGDDPASRLYVRLKEKACAEVGLYFEKHLFPTNVSEEEIIKTIKQLNLPAGQAGNSAIIHGILVQLPLPPQINTDRVIAAIDPKKDADGFHPENVRALLAGQPRIEPVLAKAIWALITGTLEHLNTRTLEHLKTLIIGKSDVFTESLETFLRQKGLAAEHIHPDRLRVMGYRLQDYDIVIVAVGQPNFLTGDDFKDGAIVIDVGTNRLPDGRLVGDVDFSAKGGSTKQKNGWITPVPGGVGPVTVAMLLENVFLLSQFNSCHLRAKGHS